MKKAAALCTMAFYLLLTTGMYVCTLHCTTAQIAVKPAMQMACAGHKCCEKRKSADCPKKHGNFVIRENTKPGYQIRFSLPLLTLQPILPLFQIRSGAQLQGFQTAWTDNLAPPKPGKAIVIQHRSLLI
jgi:hypothetical protein